MDSYFIPLLFEGFVIFYFCVVVLLLFLREVIFYFLLSRKENIYSKKFIF